MFLIIFCFKGARPEKASILSKLRDSNLRSHSLAPPITHLENGIKRFLYIHIAKSFPKIPSEMNSTHPFYPILIPNTPYVKFSFFFFGL